ncbi:MAG: hypothetical protein ACI3XR_01100 [Eubacteriales bacterium]
MKNRRFFNLSSPKYPISYAIGVPPPMTEVNSLSPTLGFVPSESLAHSVSRFG